MPSELLRTDNDLRKQTCSPDRNDPDPRRWLSRRGKGGARSPGFFGQVALDLPVRTGTRVISFNNSPSTISEVYRQAAQNQNAILRGSYTIGFRYRAIRLLDQKILAALCS